MKKIVFLFVISAILVGCATTNYPNLGKLTLGMTQIQVENLLGPPERVLAYNRTPQGYQEVWQYRTQFDEVYALDFLNGYLEGYEFLYDDPQYYVPAPPPVVRPPYGRPVFPNYRPNQPILRPPSSTRPPSSSRPPSTSRPPSSSNNDTRPSTPITSKPSTSQPSQTRPSTSTNSSSGSSSSSGRQTTNSSSRQSSGESNSSTRTSTSTQSSSRQTNDSGSSSNTTRQGTNSSRSTSSGR